MLVTKFFIDKSKRCTTAWLNLLTLLSMQFLAYKDVPRVNCHIGGRVCVQLPHNFLCFISTAMFPRSVLTTRRVHVHVRTLRDGCVHTFLTYEVMSMRNFKHITPCLSHNFPQVHSKQSTTSRLFNLWTLITMQLLTYKDVSVRKFSRMRTRLFATCHKINNVLSRPPCSHALCRLRDVFMRCSRTKKTYVCTLFELERHIHALLLTHNTLFVT